MCGLNILSSIYYKRNNLPCQWDSIVFLLIHTFLSVIIKYRIGIGIFVYQIINIRCTGMRGRNAAMEKIYAFDEIRRIVSPILQNYGVSRAYLFGSYARGEATEYSDIDLRIDGGKIRSMFGLGALYHELTEALKKPVDLITTESLNHSANISRVEKFNSYIKEDEQLIYEEQGY